MSSKFNQGKDVSGDPRASVAAGGHARALRVRAARAGAALVLAGALLGACSASVAQGFGLTTLPKPHFFAKVLAQPSVVVVGEGLTWEALDPSKAYVLKRRVPGQPAEVALARSNAVLPPALAGQTVGYSVSPALGTRWSEEDFISYPLAGALREQLVGFLEIPEGRFFPKPTTETALSISGEALSWGAIDPSNWYELRRLIPGQKAEVALVKGTAAFPAAVPGQTVGYAVKGVLGGPWSPEAAITYPEQTGEEPPEEEKEPPNEPPPCGLYASTEGNDANSGTQAAPLKTVLALVRRLHAGQTGCLTSGQTFRGSFTLREGDSHGETGRPVTITSTNPARPATIWGRVVTQGGVNWVTLTALKFRWREELGVGLPQITIGSDHVSVTHADIENENTTICINTVQTSLYGTAHDTLFDHDRIHNCGGPYPYTSPLAGGYKSHGVYASAYRTTVTNSYIYLNSGRGVQLRGSHGAVIAHNIIDENGAGLVFGDGGANNNEVVNNIITGSTKAINDCCNVYGVYSWWGGGAVGTENTLHGNCLYGNAEGNINSSLGGFTSSENVIANPQYVDASSRNYTLQPGSPCLGKGPDTAQP